MREACSRFTPTGVGTIGRPTAARPRSTVHPHGRGDNAELEVGTLLLYGSPPTGVGTMAARAS